MDLEGSPPALGSSRTTGAIFRGKALGNVLNHADYPKARSGDIFFAGSAQVDYKVFAYLVYSDPVKFTAVCNDDGTLRLFLIVFNINNLVKF